MARTGRPKAELVVEEADREQLLRWSRRASSAQSLALRSKIIIGCADGFDNKTVAARLGCSQATVGKWRGRFIDAGLDGLFDEPRPGREPTITVEQVEDVIVATLEEMPKDATYWSRAKMAERTGLSKSTIGRIWKNFDLKPHRADTFKPSHDPLFVAESSATVPDHVHSEQDALSASLNQVVGGEVVERRAQLVRAAFDRVAKVGFEGLRVRQVAEDVGIDHSTLHHHFATKQDLIAAVAEYATRQFWMLGDSVANDPAVALRAHLAGLRRLIDGWPELLVVTVELDLRARRDPAVAAALDQQQAGWREVLVTILARGNAEGVWEVDAVAGAELVIAAVKGVRLAPELAGSVFAQLEQLLGSGVG